MEDPQFYTELVHCCVCNGTGKLPKLIWWTKDCDVCRGVGKRTILLSKRLTPSDRAMVMQSAVYGINMFKREPPTLAEIMGFSL